jgi:hypothetical protein
LHSLVFLFLFFFFHLFCLLFFILNHTFPSLLYAHSAPPSFRPLCGRGRAPLSPLFSQFLNHFLPLILQQSTIELQRPTELHAYTTDDFSCLLAADPPHHRAASFCYLDLEKLHKAEADLLAQATAAAAAAAAASAEGGSGQGAAAGGKWDEGVGSAAGASSSTATALAPPSSSSSSATVAPGGGGGSGGAAAQSSNFVFEVGRTSLLVSDLRQRPLVEFLLGEVKAGLHSHQPGTGGSGEIEEINKHFFWGFKEGRIEGEKETKKEILDEWERSREGSLCRGRSGPTFQ